MATRLSDDAPTRGAAWRPYVSRGRRFQDDGRRDSRSARVVSKRADVEAGYYRKAAGRRYVSGSLPGHGTALERIFEPRNSPGNFLQVAVVIIIIYNSLNWFFDRFLRSSPKFPGIFELSADVAPTAAFPH